MRQKLIIMIRKNSETPQRLASTFKPLVRPSMSYKHLFLLKSPIGSGQNVPRFFENIYVFFNLVFSKEIKMKSVAD